MGKEAIYVTKEEVKEYKKDIEEIIKKIIIDVKKEFGRGFNHQIVGSARRNLVVQIGESPWDVDYQFIFLSKVYNSDRSLELKDFIKRLFEYYLNDRKNESWVVNLSSSVITINMIDQKGKHSLKTFDIALLRNHPKTGDIEILRGKCSDEKNDNYDIKWEFLKDTKDLLMNSARNRINSAKAEKELRIIFLNKKKENAKKSKEEAEETFSLYIDAIHKTLQIIPTMKVLSTKKTKSKKKTKLKKKIN
ncbi:MAG: hypothetical protein ACRCXE_00320 [Metamycoplasmataceae bacterium]